MIVVVFDVESIGLHGEGFAVGAVVKNVATGETLEEFSAHCPPVMAKGSDEDRNWVQQHVPEPQTTELWSWPRQVRDEFWSFWRRWADEEATLCADCAWPVEANFLSRCVADAEGREWQGPYPLLDLAPILWAQGMDPIGTFDRLPDELPMHDPLADARQTARLLCEVRQRLRGGTDDA